jgi:hypothetical protein
MMVESPAKYISDELAPDPRCSNPVRVIMDFMPKAFVNGMPTQ